MKKQYGLCIYSVGITTEHNRIIIGLVVLNADRLYNTEAHFGNWTPLNVSLI